MLKVTGIMPNDNEGVIVGCADVKVMAAKQLWALDFDGVICDSCGESSLSAWKAATLQWPSIFKSAEAMSQKDEVMEKMRSVRPVVETGVRYMPDVMYLCHLSGFQGDKGPPTTPCTV